MAAASRRVVVIAGISVYRFSRSRPLAIVRYIAADAALTAPFICRMQIECSRCCGARQCPARRGRVESAAGETTRDDRHTGPITRVHSVDYGFVAHWGKKT